MIKKISDLSNEQEEGALKVTATLLNSWIYLYKADPEWYEKSYKDFINYLTKIKTPPTPAMLKGLDFEKDCYDGKVPFISEIIEGGAFQVFAKKQFDLEGDTVVVLGYLDVLKQGEIYDIKRVGNYDLQKYFNSVQHHFYMYLVPEAQGFTYLVAQGQGDSNIQLYTERYTRDEYIPVESIVTEFYKWLKQNNLFELYKQNWTTQKIIEGEL